MKKLIFALAVLTLVLFSSCAKIFDGMIETIAPNEVKNSDAGTTSGGGNTTGGGGGNTVSVRISFAYDWTPSDLNYGPFQLALVPIVGGSSTELLWSARSVITLTNFYPDSNGFMSTDVTVSPGSNYSYKLIVWQPRSGDTSVIATTDPAAFVLFNVPHGSAPTETLTQSDLGGGSTAGYQLLSSERFSQATIDQVNPPTPINAYDFFQININIDRHDDLADFAGRKYQITIRDSGTTVIGTVFGSLDSSGQLPSTLSSPPYQASVGGGKFFLTVDVDRNNNNSFDSGDLSYSLSHFIVNKTTQLNGNYQFYALLDPSTAASWQTLP